MRRALLCLSLLALALLMAAPAAQADFGVSKFSVQFTGPKGEAVTQAGSHPYAMTTQIAFESKEEGGTQVLEGAVKDVLLTQAKGFIGNPTAVPRCSDADFLTPAPPELDPAGGPLCSNASALGIATVELPKNPEGTTTYGGAIYNLVPPPGKAAKLGFWIAGFPVTVELGVAETPPFNIVGGPTNITQVTEVASSDFTLWGNPADPSHNPLRGHCVAADGQSRGECEAGASPVAFLTMPRSCEGQLTTAYAVDSWEDPGIRAPNGEADLEDPAWAHQTVPIGDPKGMSGCEKLGFGPEVGVRPTAAAAESASGLEVEISVHDENVKNPQAEATQADIEATEFALPAGVTVNPSAAEGLGVCSPEQFRQASLTAPGCPQAAKLGTLQVRTPVLEETLEGTFYLASQYENPFHSLLAAYLVIRNERLGIFVKLAAEITTDETTGQIVTRVREMPPFPLESVKVDLRSGPRAPLITPPTCGTYATQATLTPSSGAPPLRRSATFQITSGPNGAPCPGPTQPFAPGFEAGTLNNAASTYSPFYMRLTRQDGQQDITRFSATLPPGVTGKIAGLTQCPDANLAAAKQKSGREELASPSCPASSRLGSVLAGAGVGSALTYVPGSLYLAGPYNGAPLSVAAIVPAVAGPFDVGTIVTRVALNLNPATAQVEVDGAASDPIPHILEGIPLQVRDIRVTADRPQFTLNPTSCSVEQASAQIFGSSLAANPSARFQASSCASLGFSPKLSLSLKGGTRRGQHPALRSSVTYPYPSGPGYANIGKAVVTLPATEFIDNAHISNPCTRVQFNADACPPGSVLGSAKAVSPLLQAPLQGPVYFRSNGGERKLPDIVADLKGQFEIVLVGFVSSKDGRIRTTFANVPDAPVKSFELSLFGGKKGLLVNNTNLCAKKRHVTIQLTGQNGAPHDTNPAIGMSCPKGK